MKRRRQRCPYCGKRMSYFSAFSSRRKAEFVCTRCGKESRVVISKVIIPIYIIVAVLSLSIMGVWIKMNYLSNPLGILLVTVPFVIFLFVTPKFVSLEPLKKYQKSMEAKKAGKKFSDNLNAFELDDEVSSSLENSGQFKINSELFNQIKAERKYLHDLPGHFRALDSMAKKAGAEEISQYIQELDEKLIQSKGEFSTGNAFLDDFLFSKKKLAQQNNIDIVFNGVFPNEGIKRIDITTIFHNLIENAIEACKKVSEKREIVISSKIHEDRVYLSFSNPFEQKMQQKRGRFETSKKNKAFHGYGMSSVESTVGKKEYDGSFSTRQEGNRFIAEVNLRFK